MLAASWFARNGHNVYTPLGAAPSDFIATRGSLNIRVQVKTMTWQPRESCYAMKVSWGKYAHEPPDVFACVGARGEIWVIPVDVLKTRRTLRLRPEGAYGGLDGGEWRVQ